MGDELRHILATSGINPTQKVLHELVNEVIDGGADGLSYNQCSRVYELYRERQGFTKAEYDDIHLTFEKFDTNEDGTLQVDELVEALNHLGYKLLKFEIADLAKAVSLCGCSSLSCNDFLVFMRMAREKEADDLRSRFQRVASDSTRGLNLTELAAFFEDPKYLPELDALQDAAMDTGINVNERNVSFDEIFALIDKFRKNRGLSHATIKEIETIHRKHDWDGSGTIRTCEVGMALRSLGCPLAYNELRALIAEVDVEGTGRIDVFDLMTTVRRYHELHFWPQRGSSVGAPMSFDNYRAAMERRLGFKEDEIEQFRIKFNSFDADGSGAIEQDESRNLFAQCCERFLTSYDRKKQLEQILIECDADGSGTINFEEFVGILRRVYDAQEVEDATKEEAAVHQAGFSGREIAQCRDLFRNAQKQKEGYICFLELKRMLERVLLFSPGDKVTLRRIFLQNVTSAEADQESLADFPSFLLIMRRMIDCDFANITSLKF